MPLPDVLFLVRKDPPAERPAGHTQVHPDDPATFPALAAGTEAYAGEGKTPRGWTTVRQLTPTELDNLRQASALHGGRHLGKGVCLFL